MNVTVFGSSQPKPADPDYETAQKLGQLLGAAGHTVLTGGYIGTMEAVSRGASLAGAHVIGVTCEQIEEFRPGKPNSWVNEERRYKHLSERVIALIEGCDAAMALPGGPGTLTEISTMWNLLLIGAISPRPLILIGPGWENTFNTFFAQMDKFIPLEQRGWLNLSQDIEQGVARLVEFS